MNARLSRRDCLSAVTVSGLGLLAVQAKSAPLATSRAEKATGYVDAHVHVWTADTERYPLAAGFKKEDMKPSSFTPEQLFVHLRGSGVERVNLIQMSYYGFDNSYMLGAIQQYPQTFVGTAIVDPYGKDPAAEMVKLSKQRCFAFRIHPGISRRPPTTWLQPEPMAIMFAAAAQHHLVLSALIDVDALPELDRMCARFPDAPVIIDHLCRIGASSSFPIDEPNIAKLARMARHKNLYLKIGAFYALGARQPPYLDLLPMIRRLVDAFTPQRCLWETDCPFQIVSHSYEDSLALIRDQATFLSAADKDAILRATAARLLFRS